MTNNLPSQITDTERKKSKVDTNLNGIVAALPRGISEFIAHMLDDVDYHRFSAVCKTWRSIAVAAKQNHHFSLQQLPWLMLSSNKSSEDDRCGFFSLFHGKLLKLKLPEVHGCRCCGSSWGWLIMANEIGDNFLLNPFSRLQIQLPSQTTLSPLYLGYTNCWFRGLSYILKAMLLTPPATISTASSASGNGLNSVAPNCIVVAIYERKRLGFCRPGNEAWTDLTGHLDMIGLQLCRILDIILFNNQLYAVTGEYELVLIELDPHPNCTKVKVDMPCPEGLDCLNFIYLVESCGELLMVARHFSATPSNGDVLLFGGILWGDLITSAFKVFKLDSSGPRWIEVDDLGDQMLFVGTSTGISLSASRFSGFKGNCIYYTDYDLGVFSLDEGNVKSFLPTELGTEFLSAVSPPVWYMPTQF